MHTGVSIMARPAGVIRENLRALRRAGWGGTWKDAAAVLASRRVINPSARSECRMVDQGLRDMARSGEMDRAPYGVYHPGVRRPMTAYVPAPERDEVLQDPALVLVGLMSAWR